MSEAVVRAAGGVVARGGEGELEVVLVHRPAYDDWTLPKGKAKRGESDEDCALREVAEETGLHCELQTELPSTTYHDASGRPKIVRYWLMRAANGELRPDDEVDDARWLPLREALDRLSYQRDRTVLSSLEKV